MSQGTSQAVGALFFWFGVFLHPEAAKDRVFLVANIARVSRSANEEMAF